ncbi:Tetratricopeptide repeat [Aspergillus parasiticus SU-1]|uniref:Tetratricopeptide repeat n=1 Tax=Aspergillus parasiticus (strain ATCC 56775 / NRRL 5862 / SRRC 143 / SU-1) TaxID=1403190 RepID=A0A0F0ICW5_ASPPU|nr:Tetratricopeptide repeat [Aspergillus parasiticus SU-1]
MWGRLYTFGLLLPFLGLLTYNQLIKNIPSPVNPDQAHKAGLGIVPARNYSSLVHKRGTDIVFVHGLGSNPDTTWRARTSTKTTGASTEYPTWVSDFLPDDLSLPGRQDVRIFFFNFDSFWKRDAVQTRLANIGNDLLEHITNTIRRSEAEQQRDLIFVGYSYGGLVVKHALVQANGNQNFASISTYTKAILFLGTPHRGSSFSKWGRMAARALWLIGSSPSMLAEVEYDSTFLLDLHTSFEAAVGDRVQVFNIFEQRPTLILSVWFLRWREFCVREQSAKYGGVKVRNIGLPVDHSGLNKFGSRDSSYQTILAVLINTMSAKSPKRPRQALNKQAELSIPLQLPMEDCQDMQQCIVALYGPGGIGKTQIAAEYAYHYQSSYTSVFWIDGASEHTIGQSFSLAAGQILKNWRMLNQDETAYHTFAKEFGVGSFEDGKTSSAPTAHHAVKGVVDWLSQPENSQWLLIFDNIDDLDSFDIRSYMPSSPHGNILITSRRADVSGYWKSIEVEKMSDKEAKSLLAKSSGFSGDMNEKVSLELLQLLGHFPLAIEQAGAYISVQHKFLPHESGLYSQALQRYINEYHLNAERLLKHKRPQSVWDYRNDTILTTWEVSLRRIEMDIPEASELLLLCGFLSNNDIFEELFTYSRFQQYSIPLQGLMHILSSYSLARFSASMDAITIHPLIHYWAQQRLPLERKRQFSEEALRLIARALRLTEQSYSAQKYALFESRVSSHLHAVLKNVQNLSVSLEPGNSYDPPSDISLPYTLSVAYAITEGWLLWLWAAILDIKLFFLSTFYEEEQAENDIWWLAYKLTIILREYAPLKDTEQRFRWQFTEARRALHPKHPRALYIAGDIAWILLAQDRIQESRKWYEWVLTSRQRVQGPRHYATLGAVMGIASILDKDGTHDEALDLKIMAYEGRAARLGIESPLTLNSAFSIGRQLSKGGRYEDALKWFQLVFHSKNTTLGPEHADTLSSATDIGHTFFLLGRPSEALEWEKMAWKGRNKTLGPDHEDTLLSAHNIGYIISLLGRYSEALEWGQSAWEGRNRTLGTDHEDTLHSAHNLGYILYLLDRHSEALDWHRIAWKGRNKTMGPDHEDTLQSAQNIGFVCSLLGRYSEALEWGQIAWKGRNKILGQEHNSTLQSAFKIGYYLSLLGRYSEALEWNQIAWKGRHKTLGPDHEDTLESSYVTGVNYARLGQYDEAMKWLNLTLQGSQQKLGMDHEKTKRTMRSIEILKQIRDRNK